MKAINEKRAISPLIATIILIAICIAGGLLVYSIFMSTASTLSAKGQVEVEAVDLVKDTDDNVAFSITIKNTGNKPVEALTVELNGEELPDGFSLSPDPTTTPLQPGQSTSGTITFTDASDTYVVGNSYNVVIKATFSDGSTAAITTSVRCRSG